MIDITIEVLVDISSLDCLDRIWQWLVGFDHVRLRSSIGSIHLRLVCDDAVCLSKNLPDREHIDGNEWSTEYTWWTNIIEAIWTPDQFAWTWQRASSRRNNERFVSEAKADVHQLLISPSTCSITIELRQHTSINTLDSIDRFVIENISKHSHVLKSSRVPVRRMVIGCHSFHLWSHQTLRLSEDSAWMLSVLICSLISLGRITQLVVEFHPIVYSWLMLEDICQNFGKTLRKISLTQAVNNNVSIRPEIFQDSAIFLLLIMMCLDAMTLWPSTNRY